MADPLDHDTAAAIEFLVELRVVRLVATPSELDAAFDRLYGEKSVAASREGLHIGLQGEAGRGRCRPPQGPRQRGAGHPAGAGIIVRAVDEQASDIHIEPRENAVRVRFRIDGALAASSRRCRSTLQAAVTSRIKIMARLNIAERRLPQDGRIRLAVRGREIDLRVSTMPTMYGESVVLRILDRSARTARSRCARLSAAGALAALERLLDAAERHRPRHRPDRQRQDDDALRRAWRAQQRRRARSSRSRTRSSTSSPASTRSRSTPRIGLTFATALRSILRQDPDIIMVGEIRDLETAQIAMQASLTGHLVLSTVHTNSAAATITRLIDMGVERYLLASSLTGILAQRLVRRLCEACAVERAMPPAMLERLVADARLTSDAPVRVRQPKECAKCRGTGYSGRTAIAELMPITDEVREAIVRNATEREIEDAGLRAGMVGMYRDGLTRVLAGETTVEEVLQATRIR